MKLTKDGKNIKADLDIKQLIKDTENMKCYCGSETFMQLFNLRYVSPFLTGVSTGATLHLSIFACAKCGQKYKEALPPDEIAALAKPQDSKLQTGPVEEKPDSRDKGQG